MQQGLLFPSGRRFQQLRQGFGLLSVKSQRGHTETFSLRSSGAVSRQKRIRGKAYRYGGSNKLSKPLSDLPGWRRILG